jgi:hypothetical protein
VLVRRVGDEIVASVEPVEPAPESDPETEKNNELLPPFAKVSTRRRFFKRGFPPARRRRNYAGDA